MRLNRVTRVGALTFAFALLMAGVALAADNPVVVEDDEGDLVKVADTIDFGKVCLDDTETIDILIAIERDGGGQVFDDSAVVTVVHDRTDVDVAHSALGTLTPAASSGNVLAVGTITLPSNWKTSAPDGTLSDALPYSFSFEANDTADSFEATVRFTASGAGANDRHMTASVIAEVVECAGGGEVYFDGFHRPVDMDADFIVAKAGQGIPLKWNVFTDEDLTDEVTNDAGNHSVTSVRVPCELAGDNESTPVADDAGQSGLRWDEDEGQYVFVWKTLRSWANTCRTFTVGYDDGDGLSGDLSVTVHFTR